MKAICLVIVSGGVAMALTPRHVDCRIIDRDNIEFGDDPEPLPRGEGFEELLEGTSLKEGVDYVWEGA